jgi:transmembrane sensor
VQRGEREKQDVRTHYAEKGTQTVDLPDGSRVYLNQGSEITYPGGFDHERTVRLLGEAFFEIMSDPVNPFTVRSGNVVVSVLGTSFNVKQAGQAGEVEVYVESGKVRVGKESTGEFITLVPGEIGHIGPGEVLRKLEESYHVEIHAEGLDLDELRITSTYREQSIDAILETIGTAFGLNVSKKEDLYYLEQ